MRKPMLLLAGCATALLLVSAGVSAQVAFTGPDLSPSGRLLVGARCSPPGAESSTTLFLADVASRLMRQLTFHPEEVLLLGDAGVLQVRNRLGTFRTGPGFAGMAPVAGLASFAAGAPVGAGDPAPMAASGDGRWIAVQRQRSAAYGDLVLLDATDGSETVIATGVELSPQGPPALWSPDSRWLLYDRGGSLYYVALAQLAEGRLLAEDLRRVGPGRASSACWSAGGTLYYVDGTIVYAIEPGELFTRALYAGYLAIGRVAGKLPFALDPSFDRFQVSPDGRSLLLEKGGRSLFLLKLAAGDFLATGNPVSLPHLYLPRNTGVRRVAWSRDGTITVLCEARIGGASVGTLWRLVPAGDGTWGAFTAAPETGVRDLVLSADGTKVALVTDTAVSWKDHASWRDLGTVPHESPRRVLWVSDDELLVAGAWTIDLVATGTGKATVVALSQVERWGHTATGGVTAEARGRAWVLDEATLAWTPVPSFAARPAATASATHRVYLEDDAAGGSRVMIRDLAVPATAALVAGGAAALEPFPPTDEPVDAVNFTHGSRVRGREVALVFNAMDSDEGLADILATLAARGLRCTFFVNGEFIRRYPDAVREIADSGHEVGSAFHRVFSLVDARFAVDAAFVREGLAATEDEYLAATGRELALLWHAPGYLVSSDLIAAGAAMGYTYVGRDVDPKDWVGRDASGAAAGLYQPAADLVERIVAAKRPGSIVPILVGTGEGPRADYLFQKLDLLVNELIRLGYAIVPVSTLIEHAR